MITEIPWKSRQFQKLSDYFLTGAGDPSAPGETITWNIWQVPIDKTLHPAAVASWLIQAPGMHLAWDFHYAGIVSLKVIEGIEKAHFQFPGATHEFMVFALNPDHPPESPLNSLKLSLLHPASIVQQFIAPDDDEAVTLMEFLLERVAGGVLSVDSDYRGIWRKLLGVKD